MRNHREDIIGEIRAVLSLDTFDWTGGLDGTMGNLTLNLPLSLMLLLLGYLGYRIFRFSHTGRGRTGSLLLVAVLTGLGVDGATFRNISIHSSKWCWV